MSTSKRAQRIILESPHTSQWFVFLCKDYKHPHLIYNKQTLSITEKGAKPEAIQTHVCECVGERKDEREKD